MTINEILRYSINKLKIAEIKEPIIKVRLLVSSVLNKNKEYLIINAEEILEDKTVKQIEVGIDKIIIGVPIQYIVNNQEFMGLNFFVNENVLIPQPDTEVIVEEVIKIAQNIKEPKILDLCTGSGAIAVSLAKNLNKATIIASDVSEKALEVAKINCTNNKAHNIELRYSDLFNNIQEKFNIIVSNPPYIKTDVIKNLDKEVQNEPIIALDGGKDGLDFYKQIISSAYEYLLNNGFLCLEIGYDQNKEVENLIKENGNYTNVFSKKDFSGNYRIVICQRR